MTSAPQCSEPWDVCILEVIQSIGAGCMSGSCVRWSCQHTDGTGKDTGLRKRADTRDANVRALEKTGVITLCLAILSALLYIRELICGSSISALTMFLTSKITGLRDPRCCPARAMPK